MNGFLNGSIRFIKQHSQRKNGRNANFEVFSLGASRKSRGKTNFVKGGL